MNVKRWLLGSLLLALLGGCATYDDGYARRYYDGRSYGRYDGYRDNDGWRRDNSWDRGYYRYSGPEYSWGFSYRDQH
jgi:hypothetical protein